MRTLQERQLTSTWLNIVAAGCVSGGTVSQLAAFAAGTPGRTCLTVALACLLIGIAAHALALHLARPRG